MNSAQTKRSAIALVLACLLVTPGAARAADPVLTVTTSGGGAVTGPGIACPSDCAEPYAIRTVKVCVHTPENLPGQCEWVDDPRPQTVTLSAQTPAGWQFTGWSGDCGGTGACTIAMDDDHSVSAAWSPMAQPPAGGSPAPAGPPSASAQAGGVTVSGGAPAAGHGSATVQAVRAARALRFTLDYIYERDRHTAWFTTLSVSRLPRRATVRVGCRGGGCPDATRRVVTLHGLLRRRLRPGARIAIRITRPGLTGRFVALTIGRNRRPAVHSGCLPPGHRMPVACAR